MLWLIKGLGPGGAEQLLVNQAGVHDRSRVEVSVAYLVPWKHHHVDPLRSLGVEVHGLQAPREWDLRWALRLRRLVHDRQIEVVHVHSPYAAAVARVTLPTLARNRRPALVSTEHNRWPRHDRWTRTANRLTAGLDDHRLAVSDDVRVSMSARAARDVEVLVHGVDVEAVRARGSARAEVRAELGIDADEVVVGIVANLRREKAYDVLLDAAARVVGDPRGTRIRFVAVGQGPLEDEIRQRHAELALGDRFVLLGYREDAVRVMSAFDVFTLASRHEGLPVALMDALALGLPVVTTRVGGIPEVLDDQQGVFVAPDDAPALADAYLRVGTDAELRAALARSAAGVADAFDVRRSARHLEDLYLRLAAARNRS